MIAFLIQLQEDFLDRTAAALVHREAFAVPVSRRTDAVKLIDDLPAVLFPPVPAVFQEFVTADFLLVDSLLP
jgi:hypothetical protein